MRHQSRIIATSLLLAACNDAWAWRLDYTLGLGVVHSDNITLTALDPVTETVLIPQLDFSVAEAGSSVRANITGVLEYRNYLDGTFGSEFRGTLNGVVDWTLVPERLNWTFADNAGLYPISLRAPDVPGNLQQTNVFTTGPTLRFRLSPTMQGQTEVRFIDSYAEETGAFDSTRLGVAQRVLHDIDATRRLSANLEAQDIDFDDDLLASDYRRYSAYAGYEQTLARFDIGASLGYSRLEFDGGGDVSGPLARASLDWRANARNTFGLGFAWQYSDAVANLAEGGSAFDLGLGGVGVGGADISADVYRERRVDATWLFQSTRVNIASSVRVGTYRYEQEAVLVAADRNEAGAGINIGYLLRPLLTLGATAEATRRRFVDTDATDRDYRYGLYFAQQWTRQWHWRVDLTRNERHADVGAESFDENAVAVRVAYAR
jgi:hypothetical protein